MYLHGADIFQRRERPRGVEADLMRRVLESREFPERGAADLPVGEILNVVEDRVVCHRTFDDVIVMRLAGAAGDDEIEPFFGHVRKIQHFERCVRRIFVFVYDSDSAESGRPTDSLREKGSAIKTEVEILMVTSRPDLRKFHGFLTAVIDDCGHWIPFFVRMILL